MVYISVSTPSGSQPATVNNSAAVPQSSANVSDQTSYLVRLHRLHIRGQWLRPGMTAELRCGTVTSRGNVLQCSTFLRVEKILVRTTSSDSNVHKRSETISGRLYRRTRDLYGILPRKHGEVAWISDNVEVNPASIVRVRKLRLTNAIFPSHRVSQADAQDEVDGTLICRWKVRIKDAPEGGSGAKQLGDRGYIRRLVKAEADEGYAIDDDLIFNHWRSSFDDSDELLTELKGLQTSPNGNISQDMGKVAFIGATEQGEREHRRSKLFASAEILPNPVDLTEISDGFEAYEASKDGFQRRNSGYTFGDAFCGAGGVTCGAVAAGLEPVFGVDKDKEAMEAWTSNFGRSRGFRCDIQEFVSSPKIGSKRHVDVLHMSPPCQTFSWAKTTEGRDDEINEASLFAVEALLDFCRPRAATVEQTDGLISIGNHQDHFYSLLLQFTARDFSVKWGVLHALDYGVPQKRKRLIIIASCPGETLADLPRPTHHHLWSTSHRKELPLVPTLRQTLEKIPVFAEDQEVVYLQRPPQAPLHNWDIPLPRTIKASGGDYDVHPSGVRRFTIRELACLSTFPASHKFYGSNCAKRRQVGNAVPVKLAEAILKEVILHLNEQDKARAGKGVL